MGESLRLPGKQINMCLEGSFPPGAVLTAHTFLTTDRFFHSNRIVRMTREVNPIMIIQRAVPLSYGGCERSGPGRSSLDPAGGSLLIIGRGNSPVFEGKRTAEKNG